MKQLLFNFLWSPQFVSAGKQDRLGTKVAPASTLHQRKKCLGPNHSLWLGASMDHSCQASSVTSVTYDLQQVTEDAKASLPDLKKEGFGIVLSNLSPVEHSGRQGSLGALKTPRGIKCHLRKTWIDDLRPTALCQNHRRAAESLRSLLQRLQEHPHVLLFTHRVTHQPARQLGKGE